MSLLFAQLMLDFRPSGFQLIAPVHHYFEDPAILVEEVVRDARMELVGKAAIHLMQAAIIENGWKLSADDIAAANEILNAPDKLAVSSREGGMYEISIHERWTEGILSRVRLNPPA